MQIVEQNRHNSTCAEISTASRVAAEAKVDVAAKVDENEKGGKFNENASMLVTFTHKHVTVHLCLQWDEIRRLEYKTSERA